MNTATKTSRELQASATNGAGSVTTGSAVDLTTALGMVVTGKVTNGSTGPTAACEFVVQVSRDGSAWSEWSRQAAATGVNAVTEFVVELPASVMYARSRFEGNTGAGVTVEAYGQELTGVG